MMLKEYIVDNFGEIRYTFGTGSSGGSIGQNMVANSYPGLLQGITEGANFADTVTTGMEVFDCHLLFHYFTGKSQWNAAAMAAVTGSGTSVGTCAGWEAFFSAVENPRDGAGVPADQAYDPETNPGGARGKYDDFEQNVWGLSPPEVVGAAGTGDRPRLRQPPLRQHRGSVRTDGPAGRSDHDRAVRRS